MRPRDRPEDWCTSLTRTRPVRRVRTSGTTVSYGDSFPRENGSTAIPQRRSRILRSGATACRGGPLDTELRMKFSKQSLTGFIERRSRRRHPNLFGLPYGYSVINVQLVIAIKWSHFDVIKKIFLTIFYQKCRQSSILVFMVERLLQNIFFYLRT